MPAPGEPLRLPMPNSGVNRPMLPGFEASRPLSLLGAEFPSLAEGRIAYTVKTPA